MKTSNYLSKVLHAEVPSAEAALPEDVTPLSQQEKNVEDPPSASSQQKGMYNPRLLNNGLRHNDEDGFLRKRKR